MRLKISKVFWNITLQVYYFNFHTPVGYLFAALLICDAECMMNMENVGSQQCSWCWSPPGVAVTTAKHGSLTLFQLYRHWTALLFSFLLNCVVWPIWSQSKSQRTLDEIFNLYLEFAPLGTCLKQYRPSHQGWPEFKPENKRKSFSFRLLGVLYFMQLFWEHMAALISFSFLRKAKEGCHEKNRGDASDLWGLLETERWWTDWVNDSGREEIYIYLPPVHLQAA